VAGARQFFGPLRASGAAAKHLPARWNHQVKRESRRFNKLEPVPKKEIVFFKTYSRLKHRLSPLGFRFKNSVQTARAWRNMMAAIF
jgi:hypothetical protein